MGMFAQGIPLGDFAPDPRGQYYPEPPMQALDPIFTTRPNVPPMRRAPMRPGIFSPPNGLPEGPPQSAIAQGPMATQGMVPQGVPPAPRAGMFANPGNVFGPDGMAGINHALQRNSALRQQSHAKRQDTLRNVVGAISNGINGWLAAGGNPAGLEGLRATHEAMMARQQEAARIAEQQAALEAKRLEPTQVGDSLVQIDPMTGEYSTLFRDPQPFEAYAASLGHEPGTPEYIDDIKNYRLGAWSDPAVDARLAVQAPRLAVTTRGQDLSHGDRVRGQDLTHGDRVAGHAVSRENNIRSNATRRGAASYSHVPTGRRGGSSAAPVRVSSVEEARKLAPGTVFLTPDGKTKVR